MAETEGYKEDVVPLPLGGPSLPASDNKYDFRFTPGNPGPQTQFDVNLTFDENDFPRETGSDSLGGDDAEVLV